MAEPQDKPTTGDATPKRGRWLRGGLRRRWSRDDVTLAMLGVTLAMICAYFPWYVFLNQDRFGYQPLKFDDSAANFEGLSASTPQLARPEGPLAGIREGVDGLTTGATPAPGQQQGPSSAADEQPYPAADVAFKLVHIANGRAMIEDDSGLYVVQRGSLLPDGTRVERIEQRKSRWVLVTSDDRVLETTP